MFLKHNSPNEASKLFLHHPSDAGWMLEGQEGGRDFRNVCLHAAPCSSRAAQNLTFAAVKAFWGQTLISGKCGYKIDKSREEAPLLLLALMMLVPLDSPFSNLQIFPFHQIRDSSPSPQVSRCPQHRPALPEPGLLCAERDLEHPVPPHIHCPKVHSSFLGVLFPLDRKCEFLSARLCSIPAPFSSISSLVDTETPESHSWKPHRPLPIFLH